MKSPWLWALLVLVTISCAFTLLLERWERQELNQLETSMLVTAQAVADFARPELDSGSLVHLESLAHATQNATDTRVRILDEHRRLLVDSLGIPAAEQAALAFRPEIVQARRGDYAGYTRLSDENPLSLALFVAYPIRDHERIIGIAYLSHSTDGILQRLGDVRRVSQRVLVGLTLLLFAFSLYLSGRLRRTLRRLRQKTAGKLPGGDDVDAIGEGIDELVLSLQHKLAQLEEEQLKTRFFLEDVAHELKTPLTGLTGSLEMLQGPVPEEQRARLLGNLQRESARLSELVAQLLELQNLDYYELRRQRFDLVSLLETALDTYEYSAEQKGIELALEAPEQAEAWGDSDKLLSVVSNLLDNALRCSPERSRVELSCRTEADGFWVAVVDEGPGFDHSMLTRRRRHGESGRLASCGLGLSIASRIVSLHGSTLEVEGRPEGGSRVQFRIAPA